MSNPFARDSEVDKQGIAGARWWNNAVVESAASQGRRTALAVLAFSAIAVVGLCGVAVVGAASCGGSTDSKEEARKSLGLQEEYGWNFDVPALTVTYDILSNHEYVRSALKTLVEDLSPRADLKPYYVASLFQSPEALPKKIFEDKSNANIKPIAEDLRPMQTLAMRGAESRGKLLSSLLLKSNQPVAVVVDLEGPSAVAFAMGMAETHEPVFLFDNWPHPRGVVQAHLTLAAATFHQAEFRGAKVKRKADAPPVFVLDEGRSVPYTDDATKFDNRYVAKLPPVDALKTLGIKRVLYVPTKGEDGIKCPDLMEAFVAYRNAGIEVRAIADMAINHYMATKTNAEESFYSEYAWSIDPPSSHARPNPRNTQAKSWRPPATPPVDTTTLAAVGVTTVAVALGTGYVLGRSGSWNRTPSGSWGGG